MTTYLDHHGLSFGIDTADWGRNESSAEKSANYLADWLRGLGANDTATLHAALTAGDFDAAIAQQAADAGNRAVLRVFTEEGWSRHPDTGHNCDLFAA